MHILLSLSLLCPVLASSPTHEVRFGLGVWNLDGGGGVFSAGVGRARSSWLSTEVGVEGGRPDTRNPRYALLFADVRLLAPAERPGRARPFAVLGGAVAAGMSFRVSPLAGVGLQTAWHQGLVATRVELDRFTQGHGIRDSARLLAQLVIGLR